MRGHPRFHTLLKELADLHEKKSGVYGTAGDPFANIKLAAKLAGVKPTTACFIRICDKFARLVNFIRGGLQDAPIEPIRDTLLDLAAYCLIFTILWEEEVRINASA